MYQIGKMPASIDIGYIGENLFRSIEIDMTAWVEKYPDGVCSIVHTRPGETDEDAYIADTTFDSETNVLTWQITEADLGTIDGEGNIQIWIEEERSLDDDIRGKSVNIKSIVNKSVGTPSSTPPAPQTAWLESMTALKTATVNAAEAADDAKDDAVAAKEAAEDAQEAAEAAAVHQPTVGQNGNWYVWNQTAGEYQDTNIPASGDPTILINDSSTANNRAWSAYKVEGELGGVKSALTSLGLTVADGKLCITVEDDTEEEEE